MRESYPWHGIPASVNLSNYDVVGVVEADDLEGLFREMNAVDGTETCCKLRVRSMSVGDVAVDDEGMAHFCASAGWEAVYVDPSLA
jgi:hypothetical protein